MTELLKTGVDKLISLVNKEGKISLDEAAKRLKYSPVIIKSWVELLEEDGILEMEYVFTIPYIVKSEKIDEEPEIKEEEQKDLFVRRAKVIEEQLGHEESKLEKLKRDLENIEKKINPELKKVIQKLTEQEKEKKKKDKIIQKLSKNQKKYLEKIMELHDQVKKDDKDLHIHRKHLFKENKQIHQKILKESHFHPKSYRSSENILVKESKDVEQLEKKIEHEKKIIDYLIEHKISLKPRILKLKERIKEENEELLKDIGKTKKIIKKYEENKKKIYKEVRIKDVSVSKIFSFMQKRQKVFSFVEHLIKEKEDLKKDVKKLDGYYKKGLLSKIKKIDKRFEKFKKETNALR
ncbi:hypothetical protein KY334_00770 [Candidatus Woesearchaeota archaeon]|nr:hypothetical protein [Candidatus Woesearchaeota archaeon]